jgi:hypothetical protein
VQLRQLTTEERTLRQRHQVLLRESARLGDTLHQATPTHPATFYDAEFGGSGFAEPGGEL